MRKITTFLMFNNQAEQAARFYTSVFKNSKVVSVDRFENAGPGGDMTVTSVEFVLDGVTFFAADGGPHFSFSEGMSLFVDCETQEEIDKFWEKLSEGGEKGPCGWLKDQFGVSWQIVPSILMKYLTDSDSEKAGRVMHAMLQMGKLEISGLQAAYEGR